MEYKTIKAMIANPGESKCYKHSYAISHEFGVFILVHADNEQDAFHIAADSGKLDCQQMSNADYMQYQMNGWDDSFMCLGNASDPFWSEYIGIKQIH